MTLPSTPPRSSRSPLPSMLTPPTMSPCPLLPRVTDTLPPPLSPTTELNISLKTGCDFLRHFFSAEEVKIHHLPLLLCPDGSLVTCTTRTCIYNSSVLKIVVLVHSTFPEVVSLYC